jgi:hypothetical protein
MKATSKHVFFTVFQSQITLQSLEKFSAWKYQAVHKTNPYLCDLSEPILLGGTCV